MNSFAVSRAVAARVPRARRRSHVLGLAAICLGFLMITLDATIVNVALGPIISDLGGRLSAAQWIVDGYTLAFAALLLTAGALADRIGARAGFVIGLSVFALGSAACAAAVSLPMLIASRVLQGLGAAWLMPCSLAVIAHTFPASHGGVLTSTIGWRAIFLVNVPVAAIAGLLLLRHVQETRRYQHHLDTLGQVLAIASLALLTAGFIVAGQEGWGSSPAAALLAGGVLSAVAFIVVERTAVHPMVDPALFRSRTFSLSVTIGLIFNFCLYGSLFCLAIDLHQTHGLDALSTGLAMLPTTLVVGAFAFLSGWMVARFAEWQAMLVGLTAGVITALLVALNATHGAVWVLIASSTLLGALLAQGGDAVSLHLAFAIIAGGYTAGILLALLGRNHPARLR